MICKLYLNKAVIANKNSESWDFPGGTVVENLPANAGDTGLIPGLEDPTCHGATKPMCHKY